MGKRKSTITFWAACDLTYSETRKIVLLVVITARQCHAPYKHQRQFPQGDVAFHKYLYIRNSMQCSRPHFHVYRRLDVRFINSHVCVRSGTMQEILYSRCHMIHGTPARYLEPLGTFARGEGRGRKGRAKKGGGGGNF